jgi:anti-sigma regulatory factor (Ser/Thr protein kinase)/anti-anti-sigma regulatory factor
MLQIALRGGFRIDQLERLIAAVAPLASLEEPSEVTLDLSGLAHISPASLAALVSSISEALHRGVIAPGSMYVAPKNQLVALQLDRVGFHRLLMGTDISSASGRHPPGDGSRAFQTFNAQEHLDEISTSLTLAATEALNITGKDRTAVLLAVEEIARNVVDHAQSPIGGFAIAQRSTSRLEFEVAVADGGVGIAASLRRNPRYQGVKTDSEAIEQALMPGVTSNPGRDNHGVGLATIRDMLRENGGTLLVRSGRGAVEDGFRQLAHDDRPAMCGTLVALRMRINRPFGLPLFDKLAQDPASITS